MDLANQSHAARIIVRNPTVEAIKRWVCSKKIPPTHLEAGKRNILYQKWSANPGRRGPLLARDHAAAANEEKRCKPVNQAKRFSQIVDFGSDRTFIFRNELE